MHCAILKPYLIIKRGGTVTLGTTWGPVREKKNENRSRFFPQHLIIVNVSTALPYVIDRVVSRSVAILTSARVTVF